MARLRENVLVTGGAGFIGSHVTGAFLSRGARVTVLDDFSTGRIGNLSQWAQEKTLRILPGDVTKDFSGNLAPVVRDWGNFTRVVHLAAQTSVTVSLEQPLFDLKTNLQGTVRALDYALEQGARKFVFASSAAVYGDSAKLPASETAPCKPLSPYGANKLAAESYLRLYSQVHGLPSTSLRFFNVYGPRQDPKSPYSGVITVFLSRAGRGEDLTIFGDGKQTRDFIYVGDVARAVVRAALSPKGSGESINIATGREVTVNALAGLIARTCASSAQVRHAPARPGEIRRSRAKVTKAKSILGFSAKVRLEAGLEETARWFEESHSLTRR